MSEIDLSQTDIVYTVRDGEINEELRYSLRSLQNIPHRKVYVVGYKPAWVKGVIHIPARQQYANKVANTNSNWYAISQLKAISKRFVLMNDDMFFMKPRTDLPYQHMGSHKKFMSHYLQRHPHSYYTRVIKATDRRLEELTITGGKCYELHTPTLISKQAIRIALAGVPFRFDPINIRTVALNLMEAGGSEVHDVKFYDTAEMSKNPQNDFKELEFISTTDRTWNGLLVGEHIRKTFPKAGPYERNR